MTFYNGVVTTFVKICGLTNQADAEHAIDCGADALGFVFQPQSKRSVIGTEGERVPQRLGPFALCIAVYGIVPESIPPGFSGVQGEGASVHSGMHTIEAVRLREDSIPNFSHVTARAVLLDAYDPNQYGGTGRKVDWEIAAELVRVSPLPVVLAGGLTPDNVGEAIRVVRPYAVDVCSGVEASFGIKDKHKVRDFVQAAKTAL